MAVNTSPIFIATPNIGGMGILITAANTAKDGTGTVNGIFTAGLNGSQVQRIVCKPTGTAVATVLRIFINNGSTNATATNNSLYKEISLPAITLSEVAAQADFEYSMNLNLPAGYKLNAVLATAVAAGWAVTAHGGDF